MDNFDLILKEACGAAELSLAEKDIARHADTPDIETSARFNKRVQKIINRMETGKYKAPKRIIRTLLVVAALIATLSIPATGIDPLQERIKDFFIRTFSDGSILEFEDNRRTKGTLYSNYTWIPEGYEEVERVQDPLFEEIFFENPSGHLIIHGSKKNDGNGLLLDTEDIEYEEIVIQNTTGIYYCNHNTLWIRWTIGDYNYSISAEAASVSKEDLIRMANSRENVY